MSARTFFLSWGLLALGLMLAALLFTLQPVVVADCGNARLDGSEQCDDGNRHNGDGCSDYCFAELVFNGAVPSPIRDDNLIDTETAEAYWEWQQSEEGQGIQNFFEQPAPPVSEFMQEEYRNPFHL